MATLITEASIVLPEAPFDLDVIYRTLAPLCLSTLNTNTTWDFHFEMGRALVRQNGNTLLMHVEADNILARYSITTLLEGCLANACDLPQTRLRWIRASEKPFTALSSNNSATN